MFKVTTAYDHALVERLLCEGKPNSYIANKVGVTLNTIAGKRNRFFRKNPELRPIPNKGGCPKGHKRNKQTPSLPFASSKAPTPSKTVAMANPKPVIRMHLRERHKRTTEPRGVPLLDLKSYHCRWMLDDTTLFCAADIVSNDLPYCHAHCMVAYIKYAERHVNDRRGTG